MHEGDKEMKDNYKGKSIAQHTFIRRAGGIAFALVLAVISCLLSFAPVGAELESQCRLVEPGKCTECHPQKQPGPGKCNLVADHQDKWDCTSCHSTCVEEGPPPDFDHMELCLSCHKKRHNLDFVHNKHDEGKGFDCADCHTGKEILIAVDSKHGTTAAYAEILANELCAKGFQVDVARVHKNLETDISGYDGYVIGSPTYWGYPLKDLRKFLEINAANFLGKPTAYLYNSLEGAETGNVNDQAFWRFAYFPELKNYPDIFPLAEVLQAQVPPNGDCDLSFNPGFQLPNYTNCDAPAWIGLMPGAWDPRIGFPVEYIPMELFGFGGYKPYFREGAAVEYAQTLIDINFFDGACSPGNVSPTVTASAVPTSGTQPLDVAFTATASDPDGTIVSYLWTFGDGSPSDQPNPGHTYSCAGTFTATVKVTDNNCGIAVSSVEITVASAGFGISFDCDVAPIFERECNDCHGTGGGLNTNTCEDIQLGGNSGAAIEPGDKEASLLYQTITGGAPVMPPTGPPLPLDDIATVGAWIDSLTDPSCSTDFCSTPCAPF
jgi:flavodoxin